MHRILNQDGVLRYFPPDDPPERGEVDRSIQGFIDHWEEHGYGLWAVEPHEAGTLMGRCGLRYLSDTDEVEVDLILGRPFWGRGFATEAGLASLQYGFREIGIERIVGIAHVENKASQRVLEKLGMERVGHKRLPGIDCYLYLVERTSYLEAANLSEGGAVAFGTGRAGARNSEER
jgi:RimJ/RimL family protein N-acetyltransferase